MFEAKYTDVIDALRFDIRNGRFGGRNARLPSFRELSKEYKVSLVTISKSMNFLQQENVVDIQGTRGAFVKAEVTARPRSNDIALIHNFIGDIEGFHAIEALENYAKEKGLGLLSLKAAESSQYLPELLAKLNADGFIFMHSSLTEETALALSHAHIPFVSFNRLDMDCISWVDYDNADSLVEALKFLFSTGCRRIAHIDFKVDFGNYQAALQAVYRKTLEEAGCFEEDLFIACDTRNEMRRTFGQQFLEAASRRAARHLLELPELPDAIIIRSFSGEVLLDEFARHGVELEKKSRLLFALEDIQSYPERFPALLFPYREKVRAGFDLLYKFIRTGSCGPERIILQPVRKFFVH